MYLKGQGMRKILVMVAVLFAALQTAQAGKKIVVDLSEQEAYAYEDGRMLFHGWISTGKPGRRTPTGRFRVLEKELRHVSSKYPEPHGGARMDYMLRLTNYGVAMHLGYVPNYPASHGCIRMENGFAQKMYNWASVGTPVIIRGYPPRHVDRPISRNAPRVARRGSSAHGSFVGNDPLKLLSSVPGKSASIKKPLKKKKLVRKKRKSNTGRQLTDNEKPATPLGMLKG